MKKAAWTTAAGLAIGLGLAACAPFDLGDIVRAKTPSMIQETEGLASTLSLNEAEIEYRAWYDDVQRTAAQWKSSIERSNEVRGLLSQITMQTLSEYGPTLAGLPMGTALIPLATGLAGLMLRRPGDVAKSEHEKTVSKEKEASFNAGMKRAGKE